MRDKIGINITYGLADGITEGIDSVSSSISGVKDSIASSFSENDFNMSNNKSLTSVVSGLSGGNSNHYEFNITQQPGESIDELVSRIKEFIEFTTLNGDEA